MYRTVRYIAITAPIVYGLSSFIGPVGWACYAGTIVVQLL